MASDDKRTWSGPVNHANGSAARAELIAILEELRSLLLTIDREKVAPRYIDFVAMADRLQECIDKVDQLSAAPGMIFGAVQEDQ